MSTTSFLRSVLLCKRESISMVSKVLINSDPLKRIVRAARQHWKFIRSDPRYQR